MSAMLISLNANNVPIFQPILMMIMIKFMVQTVTYIEKI